MMLTANNHTIIERVATFLARQCQGKGTKTRDAAKKAKGVRSAWQQISEDVDVQESGEMLTSCA